MMLIGNIVLVVAVAATIIANGAFYIILWLKMNKTEMKLNELEKYIKERDYYEK